MPQPSVFRALRPSDKQFTPFQTYKNYNVTNGLSPGYEVFHAIHAKHPPAVSASSAANDPTNTNGINQHVAWNAIDHQYYRYPYDPAKTSELTDRRKTDKFLFYSASLLSVPYFEMGERIKANSVSIESSGFTLQDDGNGNLRDVLIDSGSFANRKKLIAYWSFNNEFRKFQNQTGTLNGSMPFDSRTFTPEFSSNVSNVVLENGIATSATSASGLAAGFNGGGSDNPGYIVTDQIKDLDFESNKDWTISFWLRASGKSSGGNLYAPVISKRYEKEIRRYNPVTGLIELAITSSVPGELAYNELQLEESNRTKSKRYPFHIELYQTRFSTNTRRGDMVASIGGDNGTVTASIDISVDGDITGSWHHVTVRHSANTLEIFRDGVATAQSSSTANIGYTSNKARTLFGNVDTTSRINGTYTGSLAEIRFYDYACTETEIASLANAHYISGSLYQTNVAGNVFYRNGHMVVSSPMPKYHDTFQGTFTANYKGTHTIYENTVLCNIPKDTMNVSVNPSAVKQGYDSLRIDGMTTGSLLPYVTEIGLYNDNCELLAVGKLGQAIQKRNDVDLNFIVRWDY
jgi:hypothetical protein